MTERELFREFVAAKRRVAAEFSMHRWMAYHTAAWSRPGGLPDYQALITTENPHLKALERLAKWRAVADRFGRPSTKKWVRYKESA